MMSPDKNTLGYHLKRPVLQKMNFSTADLPTVVQVMKPQLGILGAGAKPEHEALKFYALNHAMSVVATRVGPNQNLKELQMVVDGYLNTLHVSAKRMFYYLLLITTRESRHIKQCDTYHSVLHDYGTEVWDFLNNIKGSGSSSAVSFFKSNTPKTTLGNYTEHLETIFKGHFSGGFGGKPWHEIAKVLNDFVHGRISAEIMMDTGFTLAHNNGPIFNKGMLYGGYTPDLVGILDVQRSGQIPQLLNDTACGVSYFGTVNSFTSPLIDAVGTLLSGPFVDHVSWDKVKELGAINNVDSHKAKALTAPWNANKKSATGEELYYITPVLSVPKIKRKQAVWS